jgi:FMN-dependent NADH-azoreductase
VPLYNYSMPSTLKAWVDRIHVPGITASFGSEVTRPLEGRPAVLVSTRGGAYDAGTPTEFDDHAVPALLLILRDALGMRVETIVDTRTLSERFGGPAAEVEKQHAELAAAHEAAAEAATRLG